MTTLNTFVLVPAYRIQLPAKSKMEAAMMEGLGPLCRRYIVSGVDTANAKRKAVLSQLMVLSRTLKYWEDVVDMGAKVSH